MAGPNLLLFGCDFLPRRQPSELVFWQDAIPYLRNHFGHIVVVSINNRSVPVDEIARGVELINLPPLYFGNKGDWSDPEYTGERFHGLPMAALYKTWTLMRHARRLDEVIQSREIGYFHYMRIFGLLNQRLARRHPDVVFSMTVPTHIDRGFPLHSAYHLLKLLGFKGMDRLVATCEATANKLQDLGVPGSNIETIRWSFEPTASSVDEEQRNELRRRLQLDDSRPIVLWSGPLQDTGEQELLWSVEVARRVTETNGGAQFVFAFKPDTLSDRFRRIARAIPKVGFLETTRTQFDALQSMASVFLSPICKKRRTVAPPLTWIEMMQRAVPVLTTSVAGVDEALTHGVDGYVASDTDDAVRILLETDSDKVISAGRQAAVTASTRFNLPSIIDEYAEMWQRVAVAKGPVG